MVHLYSLGGANVHTSNTWFCGPSLLIVPNFISVGQPISEQLMAESPYTLQWAAFRHQNCPFMWRVWTPIHPIQYMVPPAHLCPQPKWHLDQFSHFCRAHDHDRQTNGPRCSVCNSMTIIYIMCMLS